ncbi:aminopeptidase P family protein [Deferribacter autotrophicus]|uniref:Aminopeptidase P family protein n=1 Tax=Deferribacter autotrophicus TaxID=500465 RepID=A0A5A8F5L7_9BACT|nr:Xaa-Pro peptidase family protein [Deferribacter autotrophicus]KAA0258390.1 aminopeptidase P family protein [Deferribacter autotrophicus]
MNRVDKLRDYLDNCGYYPYIVSDVSNIYYLSGFTGSTAFIILTENHNYFITDGRYAVQSKKEVNDDFEIKIAEDYKETFRSLLKGYRKVWLEPSGEIRLLISLQNLNLDVEVCEEDKVKLLRMIKDENEIKLIRDAYKVAEIAFLNSLESFSYGETENIWAAQLEYNMKVAGARGTSFDTIVASGFRGALPHGVASDKKINKNEPVIVDYGCKVNYCSDITRVIYNGNDSYVLKIIEIVKSALMFAKENVRAGVKCKEIDKIARDYVDSKGYGSFFNHGLGHGVGIDVHELPAFNKRDETILEEGMVLTIEPGIYFDGEFGVRLEDTVIVKKDGCETLNGLLKDYVYKI